MTTRHLPYYKWFWQDWRSNRRVQRMSYIERGLYRELLDECWIEGSIPNDIAELADICGCPTEVMADAWRTLSICFSVDGDCLRNEKLDSLRTEQDQKRVKNAENGRKGGIAKSMNSNAIVAVAKRSPSVRHIEEGEGEGKAEKRKEEKTNVAQSAPVTSPEIELVFEFWKTAMKSPRSMLDDKRRKAIKSALKTGYTAEQLCDAISGCAKSDFHMGKNDKGLKYNGLDLILRNAEYIDKFIVIGNSPLVPKRQGYTHDLSQMDYTKGVDEDGRF